MGPRLFLAIIAYLGVLRRATTGLSILQGVFKMRIGVDLDGVIIALTPAWLEAYNSYELEPPILPEQIVSYDFAHFVKHPKVFYSALCAGVTAKAEPEMGAISGLFQLAAAGHEVVFISYVVAQNTR